MRSEGEPDYSTPIECNERMMDAVKSSSVPSFFIVDQRVALPSQAPAPFSASLSSKLPSSGLSD